MQKVPIPFIQVRPVADRLPTARDYADIHRVDAACRACDRIARLDLDGLIRSGHGDRPLIHLPLRCSGCGSQDCRIIVSGRSYPGGMEG